MPLGRGDVYVDALVLCIRLAAFQADGGVVPSQRDVGTG